MFRKFLLYGLPLYLYGLETFLKTIAAVGAESFLGPTLAGAGIGFLMPLTDLKLIPVADSIAKELSRLSATAISSRDRRFVDFVWVVFFLSLGAWMYSVFLSFHPSQNPIISPVTIGCVIFIVSLVLSEIKEKI